MVRQFHDGVMACVSDNGIILEAFAVTNGEKRSYIRSLTLFSLMSSVWLMGDYHDKRPEDSIGYRTGCQLPNARRMQARTRLSATIVHDCAVNTVTEAYVEQSVNLLVSGRKKLGMDIDTDKNDQVSDGTQL
ncbi:hypothetical protein SprV_0401534400 [Sparganum proliferum]